MNSGALNSALGILILFFPIAITTVPKGGVVVALILALSVFGNFMLQGRVQLDEDERYFLYAFLFYFLVVAANVWWFDAELRELDTASRFFLVLAIFLYLRRGVVSIQWFLWGIILSGVLVGIVAINDVYNINIPRARGAIDVGIFGLASAVIGAGCLLLAASFKNNPLRAVIAYSGVLLSGVAVVLTLTRGIWIAVFIAVIFVVIVNPTKVNAGYKMLLVLGVMLFSLIAYVLPQTGVQLRIDAAVDNVPSYFNAGGVSSSGGARLEMWKAAYYVVSDNWIFGVGEDNFKIHMNGLVEEGKIDPFVGQFSHAHNEYLSTLVEQGVIGLAALIIVFVVPAKALIRNIWRSSYEVSVVSMVGVLLSVLFMGFSLTSGVFDHQVGALFYATMYAIIMGLVKGQQRREE